MNTSYYIFVYLCNGFMQSIAMSDVKAFGLILSD